MRFCGCRIPYTWHPPSFNKDNNEIKDVAGNILTHLLEDKPLYHPFLLSMTLRQ